MRKNKSKLLIVDEKKDIRSTLKNFFYFKGYLVKTAKSVTQALDLPKQFQADIILLDTEHLYPNIIEPVQQIKAHYPDAFIILLANDTAISLAVAAMKSGTFNYIEKPFENDRLLEAVQQAESQRRPQSSFLSCPTTLRLEPFPEIVGTSSCLKEIRNRIASVCTTDASVLITGESGTGKELVAKAVHANSPRKRGPLVTVNCGAIPLQLMESELFGHEKGAFTDAKETKIGKFEQAEGGTLFLDEIGELPLEAQVKLLRILEDKKITRLGGKKEIPVDFRLISATNNDLYQRVQNGTFRLDLLYRLNIFTIHLPPLRERTADIPLLTAHFIRKHNETLHVDITGCAPKTEALLQTYDWPGNIRDLENALLSAMIICKSGQLLPHHLPERVLSCAADSEYEKIIKGLAQCKYNKSETAQLLGISRKTLFNKMKKYGLS